MYVCMYLMIGKGQIAQKDHICRISRSFNTTWFTSFSPLFFATPIITLLRNMSDGNLSTQMCSSIDIRSQYDQILPFQPFG